MVENGWVCLALDVVVDLDGGAASVLPCVEGIGGCEGINGFDDDGELGLGGICPPWARAFVCPGVVGK